MRSVITCRLVIGQVQAVHASISNCQQWEQHRELITDLVKMIFYIVITLQNKYTRHLD